MEDQESETTRLAKTDTAIEIMAAMRATRMTRIAMEKAKREEDQDKKLIERLYKELEILNKEREDLYIGNTKIRDKVLTEYSLEMKKYFSNKKDDVR